MEIGVFHFLTYNKDIILTLYSLNPSIILCDKYYPHFTDEEIEAYRSLHWIRTPQ